MSIAGRHYRAALKAVDRELISKTVDNTPKTVLATFPEVVDSRNMYYRTALLTNSEYYAIKKRFGKSVEVVKYADS